MSKTPLVTTTFCNAPGNPVIACNAATRREHTPGSLHGRFPTYPPAWLH